MELVPIPYGKALQLCEKVRFLNYTKAFSTGKLMCVGCITFAHDDPQKHCFANSKNGANRGCYQINAIFDKEINCAPNN